MACFTISMISMPISIFRCILMFSGAMSFQHAQSPSSRTLCSSEKILIWGYCLQMIWINTRWVATKMVNLHPFRNRSLMHFIGHPMCFLCFTMCIKRPISFSVFCPHPHPAPISAILVYLCIKSLLNRAMRFMSLLLICALSSRSYFFRVKFSPLAFITSRAQSFLYLVALSPTFLTYT